MERTDYEKRGYLNENFRLFRLSDNDTAQIGWHYHDFHKIVIMQSGCVSYLIEGCRYPLLPGDAVLVPAGTIHRPETNGSEYRRIILYLSPDFLKKFSTDDCSPDLCFQTAKETYQYVLRPVGENASAPILRALCKEADGQNYGRTMMEQALLLQFLLSLNRAYLSGQAVFVSDSGGDSKTLAIVRYLQEHLEEPLSADDLSARFYISKAHMMRRFKAETGYSIHAYVMEKRLLQARDQIRSGMSIADAAFSSGWQDYSAFGRAYRKQFGISPRNDRPRSEPISSL